MTGDNLRDIAERLVAAYDGMEAILGPVEGTVFAGPLDDAARVCRAYLAEHPADDGEAIRGNPAALVRLGFKGDAEMRPHGPGMWRGGVRVHGDWGWTFQGGHWPFRKVETVADLRLIFAALGIPTPSEG